MLRPMMLPRAGATRAIALLAAGLALAGACTAGAAERLVLYFNEDNERVQVALSRLRAAMLKQGVAARHEVRVEHVAVDYADLPGIRRSLRAAQARHPAAIVAATAEIAQLAREEGITTPLVFGMHQDPITLGLAASFRKPGGTMTGLTLYRADEGKQLELLREVAPRATRLGVLVDEWWDRGPSDRHPSVEVLDRIAGPQFGFRMEYFRADSPAEVEAVLRTPKARLMDAWYVPPIRIAFDHPAQVARSLSATGKPALYALSLLAQQGGLVSYQSVFEDPFESWAQMIALVLDGFSPGEIPVERPRVFELSVNVGTARAQGIAIPKSVLLRATHFY
ncbi:hypothetical protein DSM104443_01737 [Usitatibacter rugosus]|uniref:ABC transport system substrate-binding protein n=1 Tax=Usitatibacter rugosus TaxID=2732067 RepID=A0A6M4GTM0_9PROT|nr:ABC transporter substrate-binding protein [Usitatibacter rugosus]QJR10670.1 hypothetical protein DSM104443_01737 [Usitatibacter rugosus]